MRLSVSVYITLQFSRNSGAIRGEIHTNMSWIYREYPRISFCRILPRIYAFLSRLDSRKKRFYWKFGLFATHHISRPNALQVIHRRGCVRSLCFYQIQHLFINLYKFFKFVNDKNSKICIEFDVFAKPHMDIARITW